jgi:hypothetical protein
MQNKKLEGRGKMEEMKSDDWVSILLKLNKPKRAEALSNADEEDKDNI